MKMLTGLALSALLLASSASATTIIFTQTVTIPSAPTDVGNAPAVFDLFGSIGAPAGALLTGVTLEFVIDESLNTLTLTNGSSAAQNARYTASANFDADDSASAADGIALDNALTNNGSSSAAPIFSTAILHFTSHQVYPSSSFPTLPKVLTEDTGVIAGTTSAYLGVGTFNLNYSTLSSYAFAGGGNNINATQDTTTDATATVIYSYYVAPEPGTAGFMLLGGSLTLLGLFTRRLRFGRRR